MTSKGSNPKKKKKHIFSATIAIIITIVSAVLIATYMISVMVVTGSDMSPALKNGDVVVMLNVKNCSSGDICCMYSRNRMMLKRVVAVYGNSVEIDNAGNVFSDGMLLDSIQPVDKKALQTDITFPYKVPEGSIFVMSDSENESLSDETSGSGSIEEGQIAGKVICRVWPVNRFGSVD